MIIHMQAKGTPPLLLTFLANEHRDRNTPGIALHRLLAMLQSSLHHLQQGIKLPIPF